MYLRRDATSASVRTRGPVQRVSVSTQTTSRMTSVGTQVTHWSLTGHRSIATQLAYATLRQHVRSKGTQVTASSVGKTTETGCQAPWMQLSSTLLKESVGVSGIRPAKRPRLEFVEEEDDEEETAGESSSEIKRALDSTYQPGESLTEASQMSQRESPVHHTKLIVFESCLRKLFETCPLCKQKCILQQRKMGTYVAFHQQCSNCQYTRKWQSQPGKGSMPVGNLVSAGLQDHQYAAFQI